MRLATLALAVLAATAAHAQPQTVLYPGQAGTPLLEALRADYTPASTLGYNPARDSLYAYEQRTDGALCGVYTRFCIQLSPGADPSTDAFEKGVNAEHTWPQSYGAGSEPGKSDLHHLFPAKANVNSSRSNHPYGEVPDAEADGWYREASSQSTPPTVFVDEWSEKDNDHPDSAWGGRFEPRHDHKGNAARAVFYFRTVYDAVVAAAGSEAFFDVMRGDLITWHYADPVDLEEYARSEWIATRQGTPNPFVLDSTLARRAFDLSGVPDGDPGPGGDPEPAARGPLWVNEMHYDNDGTDTGEGIEIAGPADTDLTGWSLALYNGNGGAVYRTVSLDGAVPAQQGGYGTVWVPVVGLQNGAPDGIALVAPDGTVAQFLSYEGGLAAAGGPAAGMIATDIGVAETASTPVGYSLQLAGTGAAAADFAWGGPAPATPGSPNADQEFWAPVAWINEIHYDNSGTDRDEGVEVAGTAGLDLSGWSVALYNGSNGLDYGAIALAGTLDDEGTGLGALWFDHAGLQNGGPDGLALVDPDGAVVQFLSYEGAIVAAAGPAEGLSSVDLGVAETSGTAKGTSLQLAGTGGAYADFVWAPPVRNTRGSMNRNQVFTGSSARVIAVADETGPLGGFAVTAYPNPTRGLATIALDLPSPADVRVEAYDALGRQVAVVEARLSFGFQSVALDLGDLPPGVYLLRVTAGASVAVETLTVVR